jgi:hypothetical protein
MERFPWSANNYAPTSAIIDVDMDVEPASLASNTNGVAASVYYPRYSYAPATSSFVIPEAPDTYDPSHDYFDEFKLKAIADEFDPNRAYRSVALAPSMEGRTVFSVDTTKSFYKSWKSFVTGTLFGGLLEKKWHGNFRIGNDQVDQIAVYHFSESVGNEIQTILKKDAALIVTGTLSLEKLSALLPSDFCVVMVAMGPTPQKRIFDNFLAYLAKNKQAGVAYLPTNDILYIIPPMTDFMSKVFGIKTDKVFALLQYAPS